MKRVLLVIAAGGCVAQHDPDIYIALPDIPDACVILDAATLAVDVTTVQGERFTVDSASCQSKLAGQDIQGFEIELQRLADGYHRLDARLASSTGAELGTISRPFTATAPVVIPFGRADLPGWPVAGVMLGAQTCTDDPGAMLHVTATPMNEPKPVADVDVPCTAPTVSIPRGPTELVVRITATDGTCMLATATVLAFDGASATLTPAGSCP